MLSEAATPVLAAQRALSNGLLNGVVRVASKEHDRHNRAGVRGARALRPSSFHIA